MRKISHNSAFISYRFPDRNKSAQFSAISRCFTEKNSDWKFFTFHYNEEVIKFYNMYNVPQDGPRTKIQFNHRNVLIRKSINYNRSKHNRHWTLSQTKSFFQTLAFWREINGSD